jgi:hypothetical protein
LLELKKVTEQTRQHNRLDNTKIELNIIPFKFKHLEMLKDMHKLQNSDSYGYLSMKTLPKLGYIVMIGKQPIAAGFLRRLEPCYGQIDTLVSNPMFGSIIRHKAIDLLVNELIRDAYRLKLQGILGITQDNGTINRALSMGFTMINQTLMALLLK